MRVILLLSLLSLPRAGLLGQQESVYSMYMFNRQAQNPAYAGAKADWALTMLYRRQWTGFQGSPNTVNLSLHRATLNRRHGFGGVVMYDRIGDFSRSFVAGNYAYKIKMPVGGNDVGYLSLGLQAAALQTSWRGDEAILINPNDPSIPAVEESGFAPDVGTGAYFHTSKWFVGASALHLVPFEMNLVDGGDAELNRFFSLTGGGDIPLGSLQQNIVLSPSAFIRFEEDAPIQLDVNANLTFYDRVWVGGILRGNVAPNEENAQADLSLIQSASVTAGFFPVPALRVGYAFDIGLSDFSDHHTGAHELMIGYEFGYDREQVISPRYF